MDTVEGLNELRTFGWSLSSGVDVDNNQYNGKAGRRERKGGGGRKGRGGTGKGGMKEEIREKNWEAGKKGMDRGEVIY